MDISTTGTDLILVGAPGVNNNAGAVYVYSQSGTQWNQVLMIPNPASAAVAAGSTFGCSVSISATTAVIGANGQSEFVWTFCWLKLK